MLKEVLADLPTKEKAGRVASAYGRVKAICKKRKIEPAPCEETVRRRLEQNSIPEDERARRGARAAYQVQGPLPDSAASLRHGDRAWEVAHIDHTPLDIRLVSSKTATLLGTPWLTCYVDAYSRMPLSFTVSFDAPSRASVAAVLFDCVRRNHRLSDTIAFDQGAEFNSVLTESALAYLGVHKLERPAQKPRYGAVIERMFGTTNTALIHELNGNTTLLSLGRGLSSSHHPNQTAVWTLPLLHDALERWFFEIYANRVHSTLGDTPGAVFDRSVALSGARVARYIADDDGLRMLLAQPPRRGTTRRVAPVRGIVIDYLPYWHDDFQYGNVARTSVPVKIDVADCSVAFARVRGRWITCILTAGDADLYGRSWRQIHLAIESLHEKRRQGREARPMNAELIGGFLLECDDRALVLQVARDAEARLRSIAPAPAPAPERALVAQDAALPARAADAPSAVRPSSGQGVEPPASTIDDEPDYDQLETFDAR